MPGLSNGCCICGAHFEHFFFSTTVLQYLGLGRGVARSRRMKLSALGLAALAWCSNAACDGPAATHEGLNLTIVTGANSKYATPLLAQLVQLREKMGRECMLPKARVIAYDLGLHDCEHAALA